MQDSDSDGSRMSRGQPKHEGILLSGPVGAGKTSLVYAAAQVITPALLLYHSESLRPSCDLLIVVRVLATTHAATVLALLIV